MSKNFYSVIKNHPRKNELLELYEEFKNYRTMYSATSREFKHRKYLKLSGILGIIYFVIIILLDIDITSDSLLYLLGAIFFGSFIINIIFILSFGRDWFSLKKPSYDWIKTNWQLQDPDHRQ